MTFDPKIHGRHSIRLRGYDYSQCGAYFITMVSYDRRCAFGTVVDGLVVLSTLGRIADEQWRAGADIRREIRLGDFVLMPNHLHAIVFIDREEAPNDEPHMHGPAKQSLASLIAGYKSAVTRKARSIGFLERIWQRNYFERIIRDEDELAATCAYVADNPGNWSTDTENLLTARGATAGRPYK